MQPFTPSIHHSLASSQATQRRSQLGVTLFAADKASLALLATLVRASSQLRVGPQLVIDPAARQAPPLVTPLAILDASQLCITTLALLLSDPTLHERPHPNLIALVASGDQQRQRLLRAAPLVVAAVAPPTVAPELLAAVLRLVGTNTLFGGAQLWFGGLVQPGAPLLSQGHADLQLLRLLLLSEKLAEAADELGYSRRGVQARVASLCQRIGLQRTLGRQAPALLAQQILAALAS